MQKIKNISRLTVIMLIIGIAISFPQKIKAAEKKVYETLKDSKTYYYNLDQKGKKESIKVTSLSKEYEENHQIYHDWNVTVTVNRKAIYNKKFERHRSDSPVKVMVTDVDKQDKQMELLIIEGDSMYLDWVADIKHIYYYQYKTGKVKRKQDLATIVKKGIPNIYNLHGMKKNAFLATNGNKEIYTKLCLKIPNFDYVHLKLKLALKNGKFVRPSAREYALVDGIIMFTMKRNLTAYTKAGGKEKAFTIKKGEAVGPCRIYFSKNKKIYLKVKDKNGKTGYIDPQKASVAEQDGTNHV